MNSLRAAILSLVCAIFTISSQAQRQPLFTSEEKDNLQIWMHESMKEMEMSPKVQEEYSRILSHYTSRLIYARKNDTSLEELRKDLYQIMQKQHLEIAEILTDVQYSQYLEKYGVIMNSVIRRLDELEGKQ